MLGVVCVPYTIINFYCFMIHPLPKSNSLSFFLSCFFIIIIGIYPPIFVPRLKKRVTMTQNRMPKAKLEDVANFTVRSFFTISKPIINIGRSQKNDVVVKKNTVSVRHVVIEQKLNKHFVVDLNSTNTTRLAQRSGTGPEFIAQTQLPAMKSVSLSSHLFSNRRNLNCHNQPLMMKPSFSTAIL